MAPTIQLYNHTRRRFADGSNAPGDTYKLVLCSAATFDATHTTLAAIAYTEIVGNGYTAGGETLASVSVATTGTSNALFDANDVSITPAGGDITATHGILINDTDTDDPPVAFINFDGSITATLASGDPFEVRWNAGGIISFT